MRKNLTRLFVFLMFLSLIACGAAAGAGSRQSSASPVQLPAKMTNADSPARAEQPPAASLSRQNEESEAAESPQTTPPFQKDDNSPEARVIQLIANHPDAVTYLADYPNWSAEAWQEDGDVWGADFYDAEGEWIGYGQVNLQSGEVLELYAPRDLTPEEFQTGQEAVEKLVLNDAEVLALLGDPADWDRGSDYDRFEESWGVWFDKGLESWLVMVRQDEDTGKYHIEEIFDPMAFDAAQAQEEARNQAIELAYSADNIDEALDGVDDWRTYAENQGGSVWSVSFAADGEELFYALVDIK